MKRREFMALLFGAATWPLVVRAQQKWLAVSVLMGDEVIE
jgi:hypothetical protein